VLLPLRQQVIVTPTPGRRWFAHHYLRRQFLGCGSPHPLAAMQRGGFDFRQLGDAPDLKPDEGIWDYLKWVELGNVCCRDLADLRTQVIRARDRLRHNRDIVRACSRQCGHLV
jgi:hypothetical protein